VENGEEPELDKILYKERKRILFEKEFGVEIWCANWKVLSSFDATDYEINKPFRILLRW
jgi:hypothetical protein